MKKLSDNFKNLLYEKYLIGTSLNQLSQDFNVNYNTLTKIINIKKMSKEELDAYKEARRSICKKYRKENKEKQKEYYLNVVKPKLNTDEQKEKARKKAKQRRLDNPDHCREINRQWYYANKKSILEKKSVYRKTEKVREKNRIKDRERYKNDLSFKFKKILRNAISAALNGKKKHRKTLELLGCTIGQFKLYIESQFKHGMNWDNYGFGTDDRWSLDHIKPLSMFDLTDEKQLEIACHYTNFQPMWCSENFQKVIGMLDKLYKKLCDKGLKVPVIRDPVSQQPSASFTLLVISAGLVIFGLLNKVAKLVDGVDIDNALQFFYACAGLYFGRKLTSDKKEE